MLRLCCRKRSTLTAAVLLSSVASISGVSVANTSSTEPMVPIITITQVARYSVIPPQATPAQQDLLAQAKPVQIPEAVISVGDGLQWLLQGSGYQLVKAEQLSAEVLALLALPLPQAHRQFDPLPLRMIIRLIVGVGFMLVEDPVHRLVSIERCGEIEPNIFSESIAETTVEKKANKKTEAGAP